MMMEDALHILIIDDEPRLRDVLGRMLKQLGWLTSAVESGELALALMEEQAFDGILLDMNLPGMDGLAFLKELRQGDIMTPVVMLTGFGDLATAQQAMRLQAVDFLTKPVSMGDLDAALSRVKQKYLEQKPDPELDEEALQEQEPMEPDALTLTGMERQAILDSIARHDGNRQAAADELGISVRTLYYKLKQYQEQGYT